jgi:hypothetical protein
MATVSKCGALKLAENVQVQCACLNVLTTSLLGVRALMEAISKCRVVFDTAMCKVYSGNTLLLQGCADIETGCWFLDMAQRSREELVYAISRSFQQHIYLQSQADRAAHIYAVLGFVPNTRLHTARMGSIYGPHRRERCCKSTKCCTNSAGVCENGQRRLQAY